MNDAVGGTEPAATRAAAGAAAGAGAAADVAPRAHTGIGRALRQLLRLALADLRRDGLLSGCSMLMLAASLAPLLTLFGLEHGVIGTMIERQDKDPAMRLIVPEVTGAHRFDAGWFERVARWPEVAFVLPATRSIAGLVDLVPAAGDGARTPVRASVLPTAAGDPVTEGFGSDRLHQAGSGTDAVSAGNATNSANERGAAIGPAAIILSAGAARKLAAVPGQRLDILISRSRDGVSEPAIAAAVIHGVLPVERYAGDAGFVASSLVEAIQAYRDGHAVPALGWAGDGPAPAIDSYPLFRLYTRSIRDVATVAARLQAMDITPFTREGDIATTLGLQRNLIAVLLIVSALAALGFTVAMIALQVATVRRKRREYAILQLVGYGRGWLVALPCVEAMLLAAAGIALALLLYAAAAAGINLHFADHLAQGEQACRLSPPITAALAALALAASLVPALLAGLAAAAIDPGDELRES